MGYLLAWIAKRIGTLIPKRKQSDGDILDRLWKPRCGWIIARSSYKRVRYYPDLIPIDLVVCLMFYKWSEWSMRICVATVSTRQESCLKTSRIQLLKRPWLEHVQRVRNDRFEHMDLMILREHAHPIYRTDFIFIYMILIKDGIS